MDATCTCKLTTSVHGCMCARDGNFSMDLKLSFPPPGKPYAERKDYVLHQKLRIPCGPGSLFVFRAEDDLLFCHEAVNALQTDLHRTAENCGYRFVFVFRWLQSLRYFQPHLGHSMVLTTELEEKEKERRAAKRKTVDSNRRRAAARAY